MSDLQVKNIVRVCESGRFSQTVQPGYAVYIRQDFSKNKYSSQMNVETIFNNYHPEKIELNFGWQNNTWQK